MKHLSIKTFLKSVVIGASMLVPGVSGGTMAIVMGLYHDLISATASFQKDIKKNTFFLLFVSTGAIVGMLLFSNPLLQLTEKYSMITSYLFIGAVAGSIPSIIREAKLSSFSIKNIIPVLVGMLLIVTLSLLPKDLFQLTETGSILNYMLLIAAGFLAAIALILPGISVSYMLLVMGLYEKTIRSMHTMDLLFLSLLGIGLVLGIFLTAKTLEHLMERYAAVTNLVILGFVLASVTQIFPGFPTGFMWISCGLELTAGFFMIYMLSKTQTTT